jgi:bacteriorhodopsin
MTLMSSDAERIFLSLMFIQWLITGPFVLIIVMLLVAAEVGVSAVGPIGVILLSINY